MELLETKKNSIMKFYTGLVAVVFILTVTGCASIISGTDQQLTFTSEPEGATVIVSGKTLGKTPITIDIDRGENQSLTFEKEGYKSYTTQLSTSMNGWFWGNILIGGLLGSTTDGVSGAIWNFAPDQYYVTLVPDSGSAMSTSKPRKIRELMIAFGDSIRSELANGGGENVDSLLELLNIEGEKETTIKVINKLSLENENDLDLANKIIDFYEIQ